MIAKNRQKFCITKKKATENFAITMQNRSSNFLLYGKVYWVLWAYSLKMDVPMLQRNLSDFPGPDMSLSILECVSCLKCTFCLFR